MMRHSQADDLSWFARQLARLFFGFEVVDPPELHGALEDCARWLRRLAGLTVD